MKRFFLFIFLLATVSALGLGCKQLGLGTPTDTVFDDTAGLAAEIPDDWVRVPFDTYFKDATTDSGLRRVAGASQFGFGPRLEPGKVVVKIRIMAIPKSVALEFDRAKDPAFASKLFETADFVIYSATTEPDDSGVQEILKTLQATKK